MGKIHAVYAGTFDPVTKGHEYIIQRALRIFEENQLTLAVAINAGKKCTFSTEERLDLLRESLKIILGPARALDVDIKFIENKYLVDWVNSIGATHIIRGIRNVADFEYERAMHNINRDRAPNIETIFVMPQQKLAEVSSSFVKGLIGFEKWPSMVSKYVSPHVLKALALKNKDYIEYLKQIWLECFSEDHDSIRAGESNPIDRFDSLIESYQEPHRFYHTVQHLLECLSEPLIKTARNPATVKLALFFHDIVYNTKAAKGENEKFSASYYNKFKQYYNLMDKEVCSYILATQHDPALVPSIGTDPDLDLVLDIDLAILGSSLERFEEYESQIRREYEWVPEDMYQVKRREVMEGFARRVVIYRTPQMRHKYEEQARKNLAKYLG